MEPFIRNDDRGCWARFAAFAEPGTGRRITLLAEMHYYDPGFRTEYRHEYACHDQVFEEHAALPHRYFLPLKLGARLAGLFGLHRRDLGWNLLYDPPRRRLFQTRFDGRNISVPIRTADLSRKAFAQIYRGKPWRERSLWPVILHRDDEAQNADKVPDSEEDPFESFLLTRERDAYLRLCVLRWMDDPETRGQGLAIRYGAGHMPMMHRMLRALGWQETGSRWVLCRAARGVTVDRVACGYGVASERLRGLVASDRLPAMRRRKERQEGYSHRSPQPRMRMRWLDVVEEKKGAWWE